MKKSKSENPNGLTKLHATFKHDTCKTKNVGPHTGVHRYMERNI